MATVSGLHRQAFSAYKAGREREALLLFRQAAGEAAKLGDRPAWFKNLVWAAVCAQLAGDTPQAQRLVLEARADEPSDRPEREAMLAQTWALAIAIEYRPVLPRLMHQRQELRVLSQEHAVRLADVEFVSGAIDFHRGHYAIARERLERVWHADSGISFTHVDTAEFAARCCLELREIESAQQWIKALEEVISSFDSYRKAWAMRLRLLLALLDAEPLASLRAQLRASVDAAAGIDGTAWEDECQFARLRVELLDPDGGDPMARAHPARQVLARRLASRWNVHLRFDRRLAFLDYRLATLRYAVGIAPVDDLFYTKPQGVPARVVPVVAARDLAERLRKARAALGWALRYAQKLDRWLECDWRQTKVELRRERIDEIARAVQAGESASGKEEA